LISCTPSDSFQSFQSIQSLQCPFIPFSLNHYEVCLVMLSILSIPFNSYKTAILLKEHSSPFLLRAADITSFHSEDPNGLHCLRPERKFNQNWSKAAPVDNFGPVLIEFSQQGSVVGSSIDSCTLNSTRSLSTNVHRQDPCPPVPMLRPVAA
jgi:hypothetical protein